VAARSKACSAATRFLGLRVRMHGSLSFVSVVCCQVEVSTTGRFLVQRSPTECGVSQCDREASIARRSWPTRGCCAMEKKLTHGLLSLGVDGRIILK
jgi:hypothetical protein